MRAFVIVLAFVALAGCNDLAAGECRTEADCSDFEGCLPPGAPSPCGIACMQMRDCESDADCGTDVCVEYVGGCCFAGELSSGCQPSCATAGCGAGERCRADGRCEPTPCDDGYTCPAHTTCQPAAAGHGCVRDTCTGDGDCGDGICVSGACYDGPGTCQGPVP